MSTIAVIINGINLPYHVIDRAIEKAKKSSSEIFVLFLKGKHEPSKGYLYPSDLRSIEDSTSDEQAVAEDENLITDNMKLVQQMIRDEKIQYKCDIKTNASVEDVIAATKYADEVIIDEDFDEGFLLSDNKISLKKLKHTLNRPIEIVSGNKHSS